MSVEQRGPVAPPGLQSHRTSLAWGRTAVAALVAAVVAVRLGVQEGGVPSFVVAALLVVAAALSVGARRYRARHATVDDPPSHRPLIGRARALTVLVAVSGLLVVLGVLVA